MKVVTKDSKHNAVIKLNLSMDLLKGSDSEVLVDVLVNGVKALSGYSVTAVQSNVRPWPQAQADDKAEAVEVYLMLDTQEFNIPDQTVDGVHYTNIVETRVADSNYPMTIKVVPTQPGRNVMISKVWFIETTITTTNTDSGQFISNSSEGSHQLQNPTGTDEFIWVTVVNPDSWEYTITK